MRAILPKPNADGTQNGNENVTKQQPAPISPINVPQLHALDPQNKNILSLESALVLYQPQKVMISVTTMN